MKDGGIEYLHNNHPHGINHQHVHIASVEGLKHSAHHSPQAFQKQNAGAHSDDARINSKATRTTERTPSFLRHQNKLQD
jgi:hypothetical protein